VFCKCNMICRDDRCTLYVSACQLCTLRLHLSAVRVPEEQHCMAPAITVTEDNSTPVDDDDFVEYYGLQAYIEGIIILLRLCMHILYLTIRL